MDPRFTPQILIDTVTAPGAGAEFTYRRRTGAWLLVKSLRFILTTDANVANRRVTVGVTDGNSEYLRLNGNVVQTAGQALTYCGYQGSSAGVAGAVAIAVDWPTDGVWIPPGGSLVSICSNIQVGDAYTGIAMQVIEVPNGPGFLAMPFQPYYIKES